MDDMVVRGEENQGFINRLPDDILSFILSKLRIDEAVRCNILSKRWVGLWKKTSHVEFNAKYMIRPITQLQYSRESHINPPDFILNPLFMQKGVYRYGILVFLLMHRHSGDISSCRFLHFRKSLAFGEVNSWVGFLVKKKKGLTDLSLECVPEYYRDTADDEIYKPCFSRGIFCCLGSLELINYTIDCWYAFEDCLKLTNLKLKRIQLDEVTLSGILENCVVLENFSLLESYGFTRLVIMKSKLKVLKLQALCVDLLEIFAENLEVVFLDSIICPAKNLSIYAPSLHNLCSDYNSIFSIMPFVEERESIVKTLEILACYSDLSERPSCNIFKNLSTLSMDLDLDHIEEVVDLYVVLKLCTSLQVLEITMPVFKHENFGGSTSNDYASPYPISKFWERQDLCNCISQKLKFVTIRGFSGKEQEVQFAMHLIKRAPMMKRITIICNEYSIEAAKKLLSLPRASAELSINLKSNANNPTYEFIEHQH